VVDQYQISVDQCHVRCTVPEAGETGEIGERYPTAAAAVIIGISSLTYLKFVRQVNSV
jgi:hypothetical protein